MKVFKFGGASVKDADAVRNVAKIIKKYAALDSLTLKQLCEKVKSHFDI